jgi:hypothetical protein
MVANFLIIQSIWDNNAIESNDSYLIANAVPANILTTWSILSHWKDKMIVAKQSRSIQNVLRRISSRLTKDIQMAEDKSLWHYPRERE